MINFLLFAIFFLFLPQGAYGISWNNLFYALWSNKSDTETVLLYGIKQDTASGFLIFVILLALIIFAIKAAKSPNKNDTNIKQVLKENKEEDKDKEDNDTDGKTDTRIH